MNCQDCDQIWNQLLDAEPLSRAMVATGLEPSLQLLAEREASCLHPRPGLPSVPAGSGQVRNLAACSPRLGLQRARLEMTLSPALVESLRARVADCSWMFVRGVPGTP